MSSRPPFATGLGALLAATCLTAPARAQTSFIAPDGHNRFPGVTIFCPNGSGVAPCSFGGGAGGGGPVSINLGGSAVSAGNRFPTTDAALDALVSGGALAVALAGTPTVNLGAGSAVGIASLPALPAGGNAIGAVSQGAGVAATPWWMQGPGTAGTPSGGVLSVQGVGGGAPIPVAGTLAVASLPALPAGGNAIGAVSVSNLPAVQPVSGAVSQAGTWTVGLSTGAAVGVASLPALPAGTNTIGAVTIAGTPTFTCQGCGGTGGAGGAVTQGAGAAANPWWTEGLGSAGTPAGGVLSVQGVSGGAALPVSGTLAIGALPALPAGGNAIGSVSVSNFPGTLAVSALPALSAGTNAIGSVTVSNLPVTQSVTGTLAVGSLPALSAGTNAIGSVTVSNLPATQSVTGTLAVGSLPALPAGGNAIGSVTVSNLPATQPVSAAALPLPAGAATSAAQAAPLAPIAPAAATATGAVLMGCQAATTLPAFAAGQQGAVPCDTSGRPYVVTVPSANNVPGYLQAVSSGGASTYRAINAAASTMAASVKATSGMVYGYEGCNSGSAAVFLRLFPLAAAPTVGASTPQITKLLPPGACQTMAMSVGLVFTNGIALDVTSGSLADSDTTAVATASQVAVEVYYK